MFKEVAFLLILFSFSPFLWAQKQKFCDQRCYKPEYELEVVTDSHFCADDVTIYNLTPVKGQHHLQVAPQGDEKGNVFVLLASHGQDNDELDRYCQLLMGEDFRYFDNCGIGYNRKRFTGSRFEKRSTLLVSHHFLELYLNGSPIDLENISRLDYRFPTYYSIALTSLKCRSLNAFERAEKKARHEAARRKALDMLMRHEAEVAVKKAAEKRRIKLAKEKLKEEKRKRDHIRKLENEFASVLGLQNFDIHKTAEITLKLNFIPNTDLLVISDVWYKTIMGAKFGVEHEELPAIEYFKITDDYKNSHGKEIQALYEEAFIHHNIHELINLINKYNLSGEIKILGNAKSSNDMRIMYIDDNYVENTPGQEIALPRAIKAGQAFQVWLRDNELSLPSGVRVTADAGSRYEFSVHMEIKVYLPKDF